MPFKLPDRYKKTDESYEGGQGIVWIYTDSDLDRKVAVKFLKPAEDPALLLQEVASLRAIRSKHIAQIYDLQFQNETKRPALIQEYVPGDDLWKIVETPLPLQESLLILYQVASGISDVHAAAKIHRDIKPTNIKRDVEGVLKLLDFGLTCDSKPTPTTEQARGTVAFRAPEMYSAPPIRITDAVDTYAFGITAIAVFCGGKIPEFLTWMPPQLPAPSFGTLATGVRPEVVEILDATLDASPAKRPSMSRVKEVLAAQLLFGKHRALVSEVNGTNRETLSKPNQAIRLPGVNGTDYLQILYDGSKFTVQQKSGNALANNSLLAVGDEIPDSCVVELPPRRYYLFDVSHPEVVL